MNYKSMFWKLSVALPNITLLKVVALLVPTLFTAWTETVKFLSIISPKEMLKAIEHSESDHNRLRLHLKMIY